MTGTLQLLLLGGSLIGGGFALLLWHLRDRLPAGALFGLWLVLAGVERFVVEVDDARQRVGVIPHLLGVGLG